MKSNFYYQGHHIKVAERIKEHLNSLGNILSPHSADSPRAMGDMIEVLIAEKFESFVGDWCGEYSNEFSRRAMADMAFMDVEGIYSIVDIKTHREDTQFNMPNLTSVERLVRFYESDPNVFSIIVIRYSVDSADATEFKVSEVLFSPIEFFDWSCLTIGALGWGQIQIANSKNIQITRNYSRKKWMLQLFDVMAQFYPREILKIQDRMESFENHRLRWQGKEDIWADASTS